MKKAEDKPILMEKAESLPEVARRSGGKEAKSADRKPAKGTARMARLVLTDPEAEVWTNDAGVRKNSAGKSGNGTGTAKAGGTGKKNARAKAKKPNEKITPASIFKKMLAFGKIYQIEGEQDFLEAARIYSEEAGLIDQMRDRLAEDGLTVMKTYKTGDVEVAHPLLSELPRHVESANKCLMTISSMIEDRGAKKQKPTRELDQFRLHA